jgi:hypothetical protein|tara:strand:- start:54 stop:1370 length:1317 start_codon:yes stop_codon:yes gene_type:complete
MKMETYTLVTHDQKTPHFTDLVSNSKIFNKKYDEKTLLELPSWSDNSDYSGFNTLEQVIKKHNPIDDKDKSYICVVEDNQIWSSCSKKDGYDRVSSVDYDKCINNLNQTINGNIEVKGWNEDDADVLHGKIRFIKKNDKTYLYLVKNRGNHRFVMKKLANKGTSTKHLFKIKFHDISDKYLNEEYFKMNEGDSHLTDCQDRNSQTEKQRFSAGLTARKPHFVDLFNFLKENKLNYNGIMQVRGVEKSDNWLEISSIQYLNGGTSNGAFKKYGKDNIVHALETIKRNTKYTGEKVLMNSVLLSLASVYQSFTTDQSLFGIKPSEKEDYESSKSKKNYKPPFLVKELNKFFDDHIKWSCSDDNPYKNEEAFKFSNMAMTGKVKNMEFIFLNLLYSKLVSNHKKIRGNTKNMLSHGNKNVQHFLQKVNDPFLRKEANNIIG